MKIKYAEQQGAESCDIIKVKDTSLPYSDVKKVEKAFNL